MKSKFRIKAFLWILCAMLGCGIWISTGLESYAAATADVLAQEGRIRQSADKSSKTVASVKKGDKLDVLAETKDGEGYTWYKVRINSQENGYIRADLVNISGSVPAEKADTATEQSSDLASNQEETTAVEVTVSETDVISVKTIQQAKIRKGAGTNFDSAGGIKDGITIPVLGIATGSDGKNWYKISYSENNSTIEGFIREDLVEVAERKEAVEEVPVEEAPVVEEVAEPVENQDYYLKYMDNGNGEMDWFLFDNIEGTSMSLTQILSVIDQVKNKELKDDQDLVTMKMVVIVLAVVVVILIVALTILIFKLRDSYVYEEYEDEEE
ncbi:MAG: SH3 domain-containing protein, partial [Lachnospiraceae bacterium]|nr:SH3 domain-containing protein [Lachnospiraceae bacterium]